MTYTLSQFPMARRAIEDHESITVNVSDPHADPAEVAIMRRDGDKCLLILPMVHQGQSIGLIEVLDHQRERKFGRQEMRLANAVAAQAAVARPQRHRVRAAHTQRPGRARPAARHRDDLDRIRAPSTTRPRPPRSCRLPPSRGAGAGAHLLRGELRRRERGSLGLRPRRPAAQSGTRPRHRIVGAVRRRRSRPHPHAQQRRRRRSGRAPRPHRHHGRRRHRERAVP